MITSSSMSDDEDLFKRIGTAGAPLSSWAQEASELASRCVTQVRQRSGTTSEALERLATLLERVVTDPVAEALSKTSR